MPARPAKVLAVPAHRPAEFGHLPVPRGPSPSPTCSPPIPSGQPMPDGDGVDVLERPGHLDPDHVVGRGEAETAGAEQLCQVGGQVLVGHGQHGGGGVPFGDHAGEVAARQDAGRDARAAPRRRPGSSAGWCPARGPSAGADHRDPRPQFTRQFGQYSAEAVRRHAHHDHVGTVGGPLKSFVALSAFGAVPPASPR